MIFPIVAYGAPILERLAMIFRLIIRGWKKLIADMWETMYNSNGVGLAAPQVNKEIRFL